MVRIVIESNENYRDCYRAIMRAIFIAEAGENPMLFAKWYSNFAVGGCVHSLIIFVLWVVSLFSNHLFFFGI